MEIWKMIHVHPINDQKEHTLEGTTCHCTPRIDYDGPEMLIIHNSYDGRELIEEAEAALNIPAKNEEKWRGDYEESFPL